jgi:hypothetical protein
MGGSPPQPETRNPLDRWVFARIDEIHAAALRWRDELTAAAESLDTAQSVAAQLVRMPQIEATMTSVFAKLRELESPPSKLAEADINQVIEDEWLAGERTDLELIWQRIKNDWPPDAKRPAQAIATMKQCANYLDEIVFHCMQMTMTPNINDLLENVEVWHELDVEFAFGPDLPTSPDMRKRLILELAQEREVLNSALVDPVRGVIYRLPPKEERWKRTFSAPILVLALFVLVAALPLLREFYPTWPLSAEQHLVWNYALWIGGAFLHVLIQALRQMRAPDVPPFAVVDNWALWMNVKQRSICLGILWITLGFFLLISLSHNLDWKTMLFAGYSSDSLTDLFVQRFELVADTAKKSIVASITPKSETPVK